MLNFSETTVSATPAPATSSTTIRVPSGHGARFVTGMPASVCPATGPTTPANSEVILVNSVATGPTYDTLTVTRAYESSTARSIAAGDRILQGVSAGMWNSISTDYQPKEGIGRKELSTLKGHLESAASSQVRIMTLGDSNTEGQGASTIAGRFQNVLLSQLRAHYQIPGIAGGRGFLPPQWTEGMSGLAQPASNTGGLGAIATGFGPGGRCRAIDSSITYTWTVSGTAVDICYTQGSVGGDLSYSIDGGTSVVVPTYHADIKSFRTIRVVFGSRGSHTVAVTSASGTVYLEGIVEYDQDTSAGVVLYDGGHYAQSTGGLITDQIDGGTLQDQVNAIAPHLVIIALLQNDYNWNTASATVKTNLQTIATAVRGATTPAPTLVFLGGFASTGSTPSEPWRTFINVMGEAAASFPDSIMVTVSPDMPAVLGDTESLYSDGHHLSATGHRRLGLILARQFV